MTALVVGRIKALMILGGENVVPHDIEEIVDRPARVHLVRRGTIPKTSSGKIQRARLAQMLGEGALRERLVYEP